MGYMEAERQFTENVNLVDATNDALTWNLNAGLGNLAKALGQDLTAIKKELVVISERLRQLESK